jgi:hypothetical protein
MYFFGVVTKKPSFSLQIVPIFCHLILVRIVHTHAGRCNDAFFVPQVQLLAVAVVDARQERRRKKLKTLAVLKQSVWQSKR